jgi:hypothetical protein
MASSSSSSSHGNEQIVARLKHLRPEVVRVYVTDSDDHRDIRVPARRRRWEYVAGILEGLPWTRAELLDGKGALCGTLDRDDDEEEDRKSKGAETPEERLLALMLKAQEAALDRLNGAIAPLVDGYTRLAATLSDRLSAMEREWGKMLELSRDATLAMARAEAGLIGEPDPTDALAGIMLRRLAGGTAARLTDGTSVRNGARRRTRDEDL